MKKLFLYLFIALLMFPQLVSAGTLSSYDNVSVVATADEFIIAQSPFGTGKTKNITSDNLQNEMLEVGTKSIDGDASAGLAFDSDNDGTNDVIVNDGALFIREITTPTPVADYGAIYTKTNNELFFQDGAGTEHLLHGDAFSNIWFHGISSVTVTIGTADTFTLIDSFANIGSEDDLGNMTGNVSTDLITVGTNGGGDHEITYHSSMSVTGGASKEMVIVPGITLNAGIAITSSTDATPIVVTTTASHGLMTGDMVTISGHTTNTAANGDFMITKTADTTFSIHDLNGVNIAGSGGGVGADGNVDIVYPGNLISHREVSQTDIGVIAAAANRDVVAGDTIGLYIANLDDTSDATIYAISIESKRIGD